MKIRSSAVVFLVGLIVAGLGAWIFFGNGGDFTAPNNRDLGLLVFQVGAGILVVEGVIGFALSRDTRARARYSIEELLLLTETFEDRARRLVSEMGHDDEEEAGPLAGRTFAEAFPFKGTFRPSAITEFLGWLDERVDHALEDCRAAAHFLDYAEMEAIRGPLRRIAPLRDTLRAAAASRQRHADRWSASMFAIDGVRNALAETRKAMTPYVPSRATGVIAPDHMCRGRFAPMWTSQESPPRSTTKPRTGKWMRRH